MKNESNILPTRLSEFISSGMEAKGLGINELAKEVDITYEHIRRIVRGVGAPSKFVLKLVCERLGLSVKEAERLAMIDKIWGKYGKMLTEHLGKKPGMEPIDRAWDNLTAEQQSSAITMIQGWAKSNKHHKVG